MSDVITPTIPRLQERLRGYRNQSLERWEVLSAQPTIRAWLQENPLDG